MKIPIKHAIESGAWFKCETETFDGHFVFKFRMLSFEKVPNNVLRELQKGIKFDEGIFWLMGIEVVNLNKMQFSGWHVSNGMMLFDQDDFKFNTISVSELGATKFGERVRIKRFSGWSDVPKLQSKINAVGALPFLLPDEENSEYYVSVEGANIQEV